MEKSSSSSTYRSTGSSSSTPHSLGSQNSTTRSSEDGSSLRRAARKIAVVFSFGSSSKGVNSSAENLSAASGNGSRGGSGVDRSSFGSVGSESGGGSVEANEFNFSLQEVLKATNNFSQQNLIGEGAFGMVYKGLLKDGSAVAVKRAQKNIVNKTTNSQFKNEILALSKIDHRSLVRMYGYVEESDEKIIVVEYIGNGTLHDHLEGKKEGVLEIGQRLDIAIDVAHAIACLHNYNDPPMIHRDIKSTNILITEKLRAKVADFGFARLLPEDEYATHVSTRVVGTIGYLDPEYLKTYQLTMKSDVFSFGVVLVELVTGRRPLETKKNISERLTTKWAMEKLKEHAAVLAMDPRLRRTPASIRVVERMLKLARKCLNPSHLSRPAMKDCAKELWSIRKVFTEQNQLGHVASSTNSTDMAR